MKILVTGGAGFIASNLVDALIDNGHSVVIIDNLSTGKKENLNPKAKFYNMDVTDQKILAVFEKEKPEVVDHHAAQIDVRKSVSDPGFDAKVNILGVINILEACRKTGVRKLINVSSGGVVYKEGTPVPIKEDAQKGPISGYGISKFTAELYVEMFSRLHSLRYTTLRYSNVYGIRQDPLGEAGVIAIFSERLLQGKECSIFGDGKQTRDYVYVKDVVAANILAIEKGDNEAFNIGTGKETTVNELFAMLAKVTGKSVKPSYQPARPGELLRSCLETSKAKKLLGWKPAYSLEEGLKETVAWVKSL
ncbi:MAG: NAD-dependent epimerase/dehydratase family protein [Nanoarchaeota archaeon]|nr:NAD-dependent epimerase/dehydratase family protein [Nanoarchaeota archaeon]